MRATLPHSTLTILDRYGFDDATFRDLQRRMRDGSSRNQVEGVITPAEESDVTHLPALGTSEREALYAQGNALIRQGAVCTVILCGGMATRFGGVVKANVPVLPDSTFLELKLRDVDYVARRASGTVPVYLMTSFATDREVARAAQERSSSVVPVVPFAQFVSMRLTPTGALFLDAHGKPSLYATGHGDLTEALRASGCLQQMMESGVRHLFMSNVDNLAATLDPSVIAVHANSGHAMTFEVTDTRTGDQGGGPCRVDGKLQVLEALRVPDGLTPPLALFSTNSFVLDVRALDRPFDLSWCSVEKKVDGRPAIQFERLVNQLSAFLSCQALHVKREGPDDRFVPIKEPEDLAARREYVLALLDARHKPDLQAP